ncbi:phage terminase large subunit [Candidatus Pacearchaeota archaeon]|nr:phage terminase large subunit [Candidatus Pacearchaeota archaeon]
MRRKVDLSPKQDDAYLLLTDKVTSEIGFGGGANGGKSWLGCTWILGNCLKYPKSKWFIGREELLRLKSSTLLTFLKAAEFYGVSNRFKPHGVEHYLIFDNGSRVDLLDLKLAPRDPLYTRFGSLEFTGGWMEEAGETSFEAYDILKSRVGRHLNDQYDLLGKLFATFNPSKNWLYFYFYKPWKAKTLPKHKAFIQSLVTDNFFRESGSVEKLEQLENEAQKQRLLYGNWEYEDEPDQLITYAMLEAAFNRNKQPLGGKRLGVDVARYGDDESVIATCQGDSLIEIEGKSNLPVDKVSDWVAHKINADVINADNVRVDAVGLGAGVVDLLRRDGYNVQELIAGAKAVFNSESKYRFKNFRSQMWWNMRELLQDGKASINVEHPKLFEDLTAPKYKITGDKIIEVESKDDIKKRIARSTDYGDAVVMAYAQMKPITKESRTTKDEFGIF